MQDKNYKVLIIAEAANPEWASVPLIGWSLSNAIQKQLPNSIIVTQVRNRNAFINAGLKENIHFVSIDSEKAAKVTHKISSLIRGKSGKAWTIDTALAVFSYYYFEYLVWKKFGKAIANHEFDFVHRLTPLTPTSPSLIAKKCANSGVPFILGPLNGGVPWPKEFNEVRHQEREWLSYLRNAYKLLPGYSSTLNYSAAIIAGSKYTLNAFPSKIINKSFFIPENGIDLNRFTNDKVHEEINFLKICFIGRMVPYKGAKMLLEACKPLLLKNQVSIDFIGDGPELIELKELSTKNNLTNGITFHGWVDHTAVQNIVKKCDVLGFPSIREFGGGVVLEAMALGVVPIIVDYAGPSELVDASVGYKIPIGKKDEIIANLRSTLVNIIENKSTIKKMSDNAVKRIHEKFTWDKKALQIVEIYDWISSNKSIKKPSWFE